MNPSDAAVVLALCATYDRRTIGRVDATSWGRVLGDTELPDALQAVDDWYATSRDWIMPADVIAGAKRIRDRRIGQQKQAERLAQIEAENAGQLTGRDRPLRALMAGNAIQSTPRPSWNDRRALPPRPAKPPLTDEELAAARAALDAARQEPADA